MAARELRAGDASAARMGAVSVEAVEDGGGWARVYNLRVAEDHTYFVGSDEWGWSAWAHNEYTRAMEKYDARLAKKDRFSGEDAGWIARRGNLEGVNGDAFVDHAIRAVKLANGTAAKAKVANDLLSLKHSELAAMFPMAVGESGSGAKPGTIGGLHKQTQPEGMIYGTDSHHLVADAVSPIHTDDGRTIRMRILDHEAKSGTWGGGTESVAHQQVMADFIAQKKLSAALEYGQYLVKSSTGEQYQSELSAMHSALPRSADGSVDWTKFRFKPGFSPNDGWQ